jgi:hypothetical protein
VFEKFDNFDVSIMYVKALVHLCVPKLCKFHTFLVYTFSSKFN